MSDLRGQYVVDPRPVDPELAYAVPTKSSPDGEDPQAIELYEFHAYENDGLNVIEAEEMETDADRREKGRQARFRKEIPISFAQSTLEKRHMSHKLMKELFVYVPFLIMFLFFFLLGRPIENAFYISSAVNGELSTGEILPQDAAKGLGPFWGKGFMHINSPEEFHTWVTTVLAPFLWDLPDQNAVPTTNNYVIGGNLKLGSVRFRVLHSREQSCSINTHWYPSGATFAPKCYAGYSDDRLIENFGPPSNPNLFPYYDCGRELGRLIDGTFTRYTCNGNVYDVPFNISHNDALGRLRLMDGSLNGGAEFLNPKTARFVAVEIFTYNPTLDLFTASKQWIEITKGGGFFPNSKTTSFEVWSKSMLGRTVYGFFFLAFVVFYLFKFLHEVYQQTRYGAGFLNFICDTWSFLELANLCTFIIVFVFNYVWWSHSLDADVEDIPLYNRGFPNELDYVAWLYQMIIYFNALNTVIMFMKILRFVGLNPRLNIITRTITACQQNLMGVIVIFLLVLVAYSITGVSIFGQGMFEFKDMESSFSSLLRILVGDVDYEGLSNENPFLAGIYYWTFVILGLFLLLNFFIAVITDAFGEEVGKTKAEPIADMIVNFCVKIFEMVKYVVLNPRESWNEFWASRQRSYAAIGRAGATLEVIKDYREKAQEHALHEDAEEAKKHFADPKITRHSLKSVFAESIEEGQELYDEIGDYFFDSLWEEIFHDYSLTTEEDEAEEARKMMNHIESTAEAALRHVMGIEVDHTKHVSDEIEQVQQMFAPTAHMIENLEDSQDRLDRMDAATATILHQLLQLDDKLTQTLAKL